MNNSSYITLTGRGRALLAAVESGLVKEVNGQYDTELFSKFFDIYQESDLSDLEKSLIQAQEHADDLMEMLDKERQQRTEDRNYYIMAQRRSLLAAFLGFVFGGFLTFLLNF